MRAGIRAFRIAFVAGSQLRLGIIAFLGGIFVLGLAPLVTGAAACSNVSLAGAFAADANPFT